MSGTDVFLTADGLWARAESKASVAEAMVDDRKNCREAWYNAGVAMEFALKSVISRRRGYNRWPEKAGNEAIYTHDLRVLFREAGLNISQVPKSLRGALQTAFEWDRLHDYRPMTMKRAVARSMVNAVCYEKGLLAWLKTL